MKKVEELPSRNHQVVLATLNVNGLYRFRQDTLTRTLLQPYSVRFAELGKRLEASEISLVNFQEVFTHRQRKLLQANLPSFNYSVFEPGLTGPKGALVTFSRLPLEKVSYESFRSISQQADRSGLPPFVLAKSSLKGVLVSRLKDLPLGVVNTHPLANNDWDWSSGNRFYSLEAVQLGMVATIVKDLCASGLAVALGGDLNVAKDSTLFRDFLGKSGLQDVFRGDTSPTFHSEFVTGNRVPTCIDYLLTTGRLAAGNPHKIFEQRVLTESQSEIYLTDHQGLCAELVL